MLAAVIDHPQIRAALAATDEAVPAILFIGNSLTSHHDIPGLVGHIGTASGHRVGCVAALTDATGLAERQPGLPAALLRWLPRNRADAVLQEFSPALLSPAGRARSARAMARFGTRFRRTVLFQTWPRRAGHPLYERPYAPSDPAAMTAMLHAHHVAQTRETGAYLAPVALAWAEAARQGFDLYSRDGYHASLPGAWLAAMMLASALGFPAPFAVRPPDGVEDGAALARIAASFA